MSAAKPTTAETAKPPRRKRWIPLSLKMFVAMLTLLFVSGLLSIWLPYFREQQIARKIELCGGAVSTYPLLAPQWMLMRIGDRRLDAAKVFNRIDQVYFPEGKSADQVLSHIRGLECLSILPLNGTDVTDAGLAHLSNLPRNEFEHFSLEGTQITDAGLVHLGKLKRIDFLDLSNTRIKGTGLVHLAMVNTLLLDKTDIADGALVGFAGFQNLECLTLDGTAVTDSGLKHLQGLACLKALSLIGTKVSDAGVANLQQALPGCRISWRYPDPDSRYQVGIPHPEPAP